MISHVTVGSARRPADAPTGWLRLIEAGSRAFVSTQIVGNELGIVLFHFQNTHGKAEGRFSTPAAGRRKPSANPRY
jgi:hypothetical protein